MNWWKIRDWLDDYLSFHTIKNGTKNLIKWFPLIWKDRDFDQGYLYELMYFKMGNMQKFFESSNTWSVDAKEYAKQIKECRRLLNRIMIEAVQDENWDGDNFTRPLNEIAELEREEKKLFWNKMRDNIDGWWD
mgnify:CR=1 FL=1|jgi:hypothetical protein